MTKRLIKTGECRWTDADGATWLAESWVDEETGEVTTTQTKLDEPPLIE